MSISEHVRWVSTPVLSSGGRVSRFAQDSKRGLLDVSKLWMAMDAVAILGATILATLHELHVGPFVGTRMFWHGELIQGRSARTVLILFFGFAATLIATSKKLELYSSSRMGSILHEQRLSVQACLTSGLLLTGALYLVHADDIPRRIVLITVGLAAILLGLRRLANRVYLYRRFRQGIGTRKVLIFGREPESLALRQHLEGMKHLGYRFMGFIESPGSSMDAGARASALEAVFQQARRQFVDEIFFASPCEREFVLCVLEQARIHRVDLRVATEMYHDSAWSSSIDYVGQIPTLLLRNSDKSESAPFFKRVFDIVFSSAALIATSPLFAAIAIAIKFDSPGPVFYSSTRMGKKGREFRCLKFRTMEQDAEMRRDEIIHLNERDGLLFKVADDPRVTKLGRFLRKYSLDELPQFVNVLRGEMSVVGPRPPLAEEVRRYEINHLRRLDVTPGITGLWQVEGRRDPSFVSYVSLDMEYIDNWSIWLDFKIVLRTIGVIFAGTGF